MQWRPRNREMTKLVEQALEKHQGERVAVLTGAGHKYWFDDHFATQDGVRVLSLADVGDIEPLSAMDRRDDMRAAVSAFLEYQRRTTSPNRIRAGASLSPCDSQEGPYARPVREATRGNRSIQPAERGSIN